MINQARARTTTEQKLLERCAALSIVVVPIQFKLFYNSRSSIKKQFYMYIILI